jgi:hypothetical protein
VYVVEASSNLDSKFRCSLFSRSIISGMGSLKLILTGIHKIDYIEYLYEYQYPFQIVCIDEIIADVDDNSGRTKEYVEHKYQEVLYRRSIHILHGNTKTIT